MKTTLVLLAILFLASLALAWPSDPATNMVICNRTGEQVIPKIAATSDGGCYVSWEDNSSGNYDIYLQKLDADGEILWQQGGILVDGHTQDSWITDYDMTVDQADYCIIVCNDIRTDPSRNIYAYRIGPDRQMAWGADGIEMANNGDFEPNPQVVATSDGNVVIAWEQDSTPSRINLRKLTPEGDDVFEPRVTTFTAEFGVTIPRLAAADSGNVILQYLVPRGTGMWAIKHIKAQKFSALGDPQWGDTGVFVSTAGGLGPQMWPDLIADGDGGAYCYWYDAHESNQHHVYVQHLLRNGGTGWMPNGIKTSLANSQLQMSPSLVRVPGTGNVIVFYPATDLGQTTSGLGGQMLDMNGERVWGDDGILYAPLSSQQQYYINAVPQMNGAMVVYLEYIQGSAVNALVKAIRVGMDGEPTWETSPQVLCSAVSGKSRLAATANGLYQSIAAWTDTRANASGDLYLQNINPDGTLGNFTPPQNHPPSAFSLIAPADSASIRYGWVVQFVWQRSLDPDSLDHVRYDVHFHAYLHDSTFADSTIFGIVDTTANIDYTLMIEQSEWAPPFIRRVDWWVDAISGADTVPSNETWKTYVWLEVPADDPHSLPRNFAIESVYPNPFNAEARIRLSIPHETQLQLKVYDILGRHISTLWNSHIEPGYRDFRINGKDMASGIYLVRAEMDGRSSLTQRIVLLK